jgi:hypothetical protein
MLTSNTRFLLFAACAFLGLACGQDEATGPTPRTIAGTYMYTFTDVTNGSGLTCSGSATMPLTQSGTGFSGTYSGSIACNGGAAQLVAGQVVNGRVSGDSVSFDLDDEGWHNSGVFEGPRFGGVVRVNGSMQDGTPIALAGTFTCVKQ